MEDLLILIATYRCNLNCSYCPTVKSDKSLSWDIAKKSLDLFNKLGSKNPKIKFFGGEPLLEFDLIEKIVEYNKRLNQKTRYELTTNGVLLDKEKIAFLKKNNFELRVSIDGNKITQTSERGNKSWTVFEKLDKKDREYVIVNMVVSPRQVTKFYENFRFLFESGFKNFNLLPAFFNSWSKQKIDLFENKLLKIAKFASNKNIYIKNVDIWQKDYLFNKGYVLDYNGDIYSDNRIMIDDYHNLREISKLGNIKGINSFLELENKEPVLNGKYHLTNLDLDKRLTLFVNLLQTLRKKK